MAEPTAVLIFDDVVRIIQSALAPVFLLAGTAGFLNAFSSRLARVADRVNTITDLIAVENGVSEAQMSQLVYLRRRTLAGPAERRAARGIQRGDAVLVLRWSGRLPDRGAVRVSLRDACGQQQPSETDRRRQKGQARQGYRPKAQTT